MATRPATQDHLPKQPKKSTAEAAAEPFGFTGVDGKFYPLPPSVELKAGLIRKTRHMGELDQAFTIIEALVDDETLAALDELPADLFNAVILGWQTAIGTNPGK